MSSSLRDEYNYWFKVRRLERVVDGDTVYLEVDLGFYQFGVYNFRLARIDCPERYGRYATEEGLDAMKFTKGWLESELDKGNEVMVATKKADSFGRWIGDIVSLSPESVRHLSDDLVVAELAVYRDY